MSDTATAPEQTTDTQTAPSGAPVKSFAPEPAPAPEVAPETPAWGMGDPFISDTPPAPAEASSPPAADDAAGADSVSPSADDAPAAEAVEPEILRLDGREVDITGWPESAVDALKAQDAHHRKVQGDRDRAKQAEAAYEKQLAAMRAEFDAKLAEVKTAAPKEPAKPTVTDYDRMIAEATGQDPDAVAAAREAATPKDSTADELKRELAELKQANEHRAKQEKFERQLVDVADAEYTHYTNDPRYTKADFIDVWRDAFMNFDQHFAESGEKRNTRRGQAIITRAVHQYLVDLYKDSNQTNGHADEAGAASDPGVANGNGKSVSGPRRAAPKAPVKPAAGAPARKGMAQPAADDLSVDARRARAQAAYAANASQ